MMLNATAFSIREGIGVELSPDYIKLAQKRTENSRKQGVLFG